MVSAQEQFEQKLAKSLLAENLVNKNELNEAIEQQVLTGGDLATNLWELGLCSVTEVTKHSTQLLEVRAVPPKVVARTSRKVLRILPRHFVERHRIIPINLKGRQLSIATCAPWDIETLDDTAKHSNLRIKPFFLAEVPLMKLLEKLYKLPISARFKLKPQKRIRHSEQAASSEPELTEDLISDEEFTAIYGAGDGANFSDPFETTDETEHDSEREPANNDTVVIEDAELIKDPEKEIAEEVLELAEVIEDEPEKVVEPISDMNEAYALLEAAKNRDELGEILVRVALSRGKRALLLTLQREMWLGWTGAGEGLQESSVRSLMLPSEQGTCFGLVNMTKAHFLGPLTPHPVHDRFLELLGTAKPNTVGLFPVHFRGKIVFGLYMDAGDGGFVSPDIADILIVAQRVPMAIERLLQQAQSA